MIKLTNITKEFNDGSKTIEVLKPTTLTLNKGEFVAIIGPSGSGKSTMLTIMGALQTPTHGQLSIGDKDINLMSEKQRSTLRFEEIGFVLQGSNLVPYLSVSEQFELKLKQSKFKSDKNKINAILENLSISHIRNKYPENISGGEKQRVAIGLALLLNPKIILADEPTASLDTEKAFDVIETLSKVSKDFDTCVVMVTHDPRMLKYCDRIFEMTDGVLKETK